MEKDHMTKKMIGTIVGAGIAGLIVGYLIFGKIEGDYVSWSTIFSSSNNFLESAEQSIFGIDSIRNKILLCGGGGVLISVISIFLPKLKS